MPLSSSIFAVFLKTRPNGLRALIRDSEQSSADTERNFRRKQNLDISSGFDCMNDRGSIGEEAINSLCFTFFGPEKHFKPLEFKYEQHVISEMETRRQEEH